MPGAGQQQGGYQQLGAPPSNLRAPADWQRAQPQPGYQQQPVYNQPPQQPAYNQPQPNYAPPQQTYSQPNRSRAALRHRREMMTRICRTTRSPVRRRRPFDRNLCVHCRRSVRRASSRSRHRRRWR